MKFVDIQTRNGMVNLDGYCTAKTLKGAIKELAREVAKIDKGEANVLTDFIDDTVEMVKQGMLNETGCYYVEFEEVGCASRYIFLDGDDNNYDDDNIEIEYADANWYAYIRFCA